MDIVAELTKIHDEPYFYDFYHEAATIACRKEITPHDLATEVFLALDRALKGNRKVFSITGLVCHKSWLSVLCNNDPVRTTAAIEAWKENETVLAKLLPQNAEEEAAYQKWCSDRK